MVDKTFEVLEPKFKTINSSSDFRNAVKMLDQKLPGLNLKDDTGATSSRRLLGAVQEWEDGWCEKVTEDESQVLGLVSLVVGTVDANVNLSNMGSPEALRKLRMNSVEMQREAVRVLFNNLDEDGRPNKTLMKTMSLITAVFETALYETPDRVYSRGLRSQINFWQGVMGMVTVAEMFKAVGWKVAFGKVEWDLDDGVDLVVLNPDGYVFLVDVTEKMDYERENKIYKISVDGAEGSKFYREIENLRGVIKINIPPLRSQESEGFYDPKMRSVGYPTEEKIAFFRETVSRR